MPIKRIDATRCTRVETTSHFYLILTYEYSNVNDQALFPVNMPNKHKQKNIKLTLRYCTIHPGSIKCVTKYDSRSPLGTYTLGIVKG